MAVSQDGKLLDHDKDFEQLHERVLKLERTDLVLGRLSSWSSEVDEEEAPMTDKFYERAIRWFDEQPPRSNFTHARQSLAVCLREVAAAERERIQQIVLAVILGGVCRRPKDGHECGLPAVGIDLDHSRPLCAACLKSPGVEGLPLSDLFGPSRTEGAATTTQDSGPSRVDPRPAACCVCARVITVESSTTPHPEAPEMVKVPPDAWIGFVQGDNAPEMILVCSESCRRTLLSA